MLPLIRNCLRTVLIYLYTSLHKYLLTLIWYAVNLLTSRGNHALQQIRGDNMSNWDKKDVTSIRFCTYSSEPKTHDNMLDSYKLTVDMTRGEAINLREILAADKRVGSIHLGLEGNRAI